MAAALQNVQELQRANILKMLDIGGDHGGGQTWKVFVYDKFCQEVVAPLLKIGGLTKQGVTLRHRVEEERQPVADVPVVYFLEPTSENIRRIIEDLQRGLYESCYINFASAVTRPLLEELALGSMKAKASQKVAGVFDRYISFVSLSSALFSLNLPAAYETLNSTGLSDDIIQGYVERIVDGLLSVLVTMRCLPVIRCPPGVESPIAEMVAIRLEARIRELLVVGGATASELFSSAVGLPQRPGDIERPVLCILHRDVDLVTMLHHTWTYQAMAHDVFGMRLNKLTVTVDAAGGSGDGGGSSKQESKHYDVDEADAFWASYAGAPFPVAANAAHEAIEEFNKKRAELSANDAEVNDQAPLSSGLAEAINALPEMTQKKRSIDMHTTILTALLEEIKARELGKYYEMEDSFASQKTDTSVAELQKLLAGGAKGTLGDKTRALMVLYLTKSKSITAPQLQTLTDALKSAGGETEALGVAYLQRLASLRGMMVPLAGSSNSSASSAGFPSISSIGSQFAESFVKNLQNIVSTKLDMPVCQIMEGVMEQKPTGVTENYLYLDPKATSAAGGEVPRIKGQFRRGIAFIVGGGNYAEMQCLHEWSQEKSWQVVYGSTDMVSPLKFVEELCHLGQSEVGGDLR